MDESKKFAVLVLGEQVVGEQDVQDRVRLNFCDICVQKLQTVLDERGIDFILSKVLHEDWETLHVGLLCGITASQELLHELF